MEDYDQHTSSHVDGSLKAFNVPGLNNMCFEMGFATTPVVYATNDYEYRYDRSVYNT